MRGGRHNNRQNDMNEELETLSEDNEELQKANAEQRVALDVTNERMQKIMHVFDLIHDKLINAKIGKHVAMVIAATGQTAEEVIKTVGLTNCMPDHSEITNLIIENHYSDFINFVSTGDAKAKHELIGKCMKASGGKLNPGLVSQYIDKLVNDFKNCGRDQYDKELKAWENDTELSATMDFDNPHFKAIVAMGDKCIPWIHDTINKCPHPVVNALDRIMPGVCQYIGLVSLQEVCDAWKFLLSFTKDQRVTT